MQKSNIPVQSGVLMIKRQALEYVQGNTGSLAAFKLYLNEQMRDN